jgi:selenide,water dikinase
LPTAYPSGDPNPTASALASLTSLSPAGGCGCKLGPGDLGVLLERLDASRRGFGRSPWDDAALFQPDRTSSLLMTVDFFTPLVDDPEDWGAIAAANALSDIYAMGGHARLALSIAAWPHDLLPLEQLSRALGAAQAKFAEAGADLAGGHTIRDSTPKLGFAVLGEVSESAVLEKSRGRAGDVLVLTKPLGSGTVVSALKAGCVSEALVRRTVEVMTSLNRRAASVATRHGVRCATDVTGFGLAGHLHDLALASNVSAVVDLHAVPVIAGAEDLVGSFPTSNALPNRRYSDTVFGFGVDPEVSRAALLFDPQSSGGLLLACPLDDLSALRSDLRAVGAGDSVVGRLTPPDPAGRIVVGP